MRKVLLTMAISVLSLMSTESTSQEPNCKLKECPGKAAIDHNDGTHHFITTSRVYKHGNDHMYETCVENVDDKDLEINWVIPGPESVVLKGCAIQAYRSQSHRDTLDSYSGCIRYGASWKWKRAPFFPHLSEATEINAEKGSECRGIHVVNPINERSSKPRNIEIKSERFGASVYEDFKNTLSKIDFLLKTNVLPDGNIYTTSLTFSFSSAYLDQPKHYIKGFSIVPTESAIKFGYFDKASGNPKGDFFTDKGKIEYTLPIPEKTVQRFVRYRVLSVEMRPVASIDVPIWIESE